MKDKILTLIIGVLIGAIITSAGFVIYMKTNNTGKNHNFGKQPQMNQSQDGNQGRGTPPDLPNGEKPSGNQKGETTNGNSNNDTSTQKNEQTQSNS